MYSTTGMERTWCDRGVRSKSMWGRYGGRAPVEGGGRCRARAAEARGKAFPLNSYDFGFILSNNCFFSAGPDWLSIVENPVVISSSPFANPAITESM